MPIKEKKIMVHTVNCPICNKEIEGYSDDQNKYNLEIHIKQKHPEQKNGNQ